MESMLDFSNLLMGLQRLPEQEKIILVAIINAHGTAGTGDAGKIERMVAQTIMAAARENRTSGRTENPTLCAAWVS